MDRNTHIAIDISVRVKIRMIAYFPERRESYEKSRSITVLGPIAPIV